MTSSKTVLITGASSGIGRATAEYFQARGWKVVATMRNPSVEHELMQLANVHCLALDVHDEASIRDALIESIQLFGSVDVVVNNAGYGALGPFEAASVDQVRRQFETNVFGVMNVMRVFLPYFREKKHGLFVNVSSVGGQVTWPLYSLYHATKWAVEGFTESISYELKQFGIRVKLVEPGAIKTDFYSRSQDVFNKPGLTAYDSYVNRVMPNLQQAGADAPGPEVVAATIFKAATDGSNRLRYPVGSNAPMFLFLRRIIPHSWFRKVVSGQTETPRKVLSKYQAEKE